MTNKSGLVLSFVGYAMLVPCTVWAKQPAQTPAVQIMPMSAAAVPNAPSDIRSASFGRPFSLIDHKGREITDANYRDRWMLVFFGYTSNFECGRTLENIGTAMKELGSLADQVTPLFITVDPAGDTPDHLASYLGKFDSRIVGLTGTGRQIAAAASSYRVNYSNLTQSGEDVLTHLRFLYLVSPHRRLDALMRVEASANHLAMVLRRRLSAQMPATTSY